MHDVAMLIGVLTVLNLLFGIFSVVWVWRYPAYEQLLGGLPTEGEGRPRWAWLLVPAMGVAALSLFFLGGLGLLLLLVLLIIWVMWVIRWPWHGLRLAGRSARTRFVVMLVAGLIGGTLIDWLRVSPDIALPQTVLMGLFVLGVCLLVIQRSVMLAAHVLLWGCMTPSGHYAVRALLLTLFTGYFGLFYSLWRAHTVCSSDPEPVDTDQAGG